MNRRVVYEEDYQDIIDHFGKKSKEPWSKKKLADYLGVSTTTIFNYAWRLGLVEGRTPESYDAEMKKRIIRQCGEIGSDKRKDYNKRRREYSNRRYMEVEKFMRYKRTTS